MISSKAKRNFKISKLTKINCSIHKTWRRSSRYWMKSIKILMLLCLKTTKASCGRLWGMYLMLIKVRALMMMILTTMMMMMIIIIQSKPITTKLISRKIFQSLIKKLSIQKSVLPEDHSFNMKKLIILTAKMKNMRSLVQYLKWKMIKA